MRRFFLIVTSFVGAGLLTAGSCGEDGGEGGQGGAGGGGTFGAPSNLVGAPASSTSASLNWTDNSSTETGFSIERSTNGTTFAQAGTVGANVIAFTDTGLTAATLYYYRVAAVSGSQTSGYSNTVQVTTSSVTLAAPTGLTAVLASGPVINLQWTYSAPAPTNFRVEYGNDGIAYTEIVTVGGAVTSYSHATFDTTKTTHYYRVRAFTSPDYSNYSNVASVVYQLPVAPTNLAAVPVSSLNIDLTWKDNSTGEIGFKIYRSFTGTSIPGAYTLRATVGPNVQNFTDSGLFPSTTYYYYVRAYNSINESEATPSNLTSAMSNTAFATTYSGYWAEIAASATGSGISNDSANSHTPSLAVDNWGRIVVVWANDVNGVDQIRLAFFDPSATGSASGWLGIETYDPSSSTESTEQESDILSNVGSGISMSGGDCSDPIVIWDGTSAFHIVWSEKRNGEWEIVYRTVRSIAWDVNDNCYEAVWGGIDDGGTWVSTVGGGHSDVLLATTHGYRISTEATAGHDQRPRAFYRSNVHYVVWQKYTTSWDIYLTRLDLASLTVVPPNSAPETISGTAATSTYPTVVATSANLFAFWQEEVSGSWKIYGRQSSLGTGAGVWAMITGAASSDSSNGIFANATGDAQHPAATAVTVSTVDNIYLAADANTSGPHQIYLLKYNNTVGLSFKEVSDTIIDSDNLAGGGISASTGTSQYPSVAGDTLGNVYVAWQDSTDGDFDIFVRRYAVGVPGESNAWVAMGSSTGPPGISNNTNDSVLPQILIDSAEPVYLIWEDLSSGDSDVLLRRW